MNMEKIVNIFKKSTKNLEIERKFLLSNIPNLNYTDELLIYQFYTDVNGIINRFREIRNIKSQDSIYQHCIKTPLSHGTFQEIETEISYDDFQNMRKNEIGNILKKRFIYTENNLKWEIDDYLNIKLITLEVELIDIKQNIIIPPTINDYIITEITGNKLFSNHNLSLKK